MHTSLFPNTDGLDEFKKIVIKNTIEKLNTERITLTFPIILNAKIVILTKGDNKNVILDIEFCKEKEGITSISKVLKSNADITWIKSK